MKLSEAELDAAIREMESTRDWESQFVGRIAPNIEPEPEPDPIVWHDIVLSVVLVFVLAVVVFT